MSERLLRVCEVVSYPQVPGKHVYELIKRKALLMNGDGWDDDRRIRAVRSL